MNIETEKNKIRSIIKKLRINYFNNTSKNERAEKHKKIVQNFIFFLNKIKKINTIALYWPIQYEIPIFQIIELFEKENINICLPATKNDKTLEFLKWNSKEALINDIKNTKKPPKKNKINPDIIIAPLLSFDHQNNRLGYGGGYYDETIKKIKKNNNNLLTIGIALEFQRSIKQLPTSLNDEKLTTIITETKIYTK